MTVRQGIFWGVMTFIGIFVLSILFGATTSVPQGSVGVYLTFGKAQPQYLKPGLHFKMPFTDTIELMPVTTTRFDSGKISLKSKDQQEVNTNITVTYHILPANAVKLYGQVAGDPSQINDILVKPTVPGIAGQSFSNYTIQQLVTQRDNLRLNLEQRLRKNFAMFGLAVDDVNIVEFGFSKTYNTAIESKMSADQAKLTAQLVLDKETIAAHIRVVNATASADAALENARGKAGALIVNANAEAKAIEIASKALNNAPASYIPYLVATNWDGKLPQVSSSSGSSNIISLPSVGR